MLSVWCSGCILTALCVLRGDWEEKGRRGKPTQKGKIVQNKDWVRQDSLEEGEEVNKRGDC